VKKLRVYLDTSVISHLDAPDVPDKEADTRRLWEDIRAGKYEVFISPVVVNEIEACYEAKRETLKRYLTEIDYSIVAIDDKAFDIASRFVDLGILRQKSFDDCQHIAAAIISGCDIIVSWNFKHIVNHKTTMGVKAITALEGYNDLLIYAPSSLIGGEGYDS
jgi:predicted nucleic acid-binding protein